MDLPCLAVRAAQLAWIQENSFGKLCGKRISLVQGSTQRVKCLLPLGSALYVPKDGGCEMDSFEVEDCGEADQDLDSVSPLRRVHA